MAMGPVRLSAGGANGRGFHGEANMPRATVTRPARWRIAAAALAGGLLLAACSSSTTPPPIQSPSQRPAPAATSAAAAAATPSAASAVCQAAAGLRASVYALDHVTIGKGHAGAIKTDVANIEAKFTALTAAVRGGFKAQTSAVKAALDALKTAVSDLAAHPSAKAVAGVVTAASGGRRDRQQPAGRARPPVRVRVRFTQPVSDIHQVWLIKGETVGRRSVSR